MDKSFTDICEEMCESIDRIAQLDLEKDTPLYNLQQGLISSARRYRRQKGIENE